MSPNRASRNNAYSPGRWTGAVCCSKELEGRFRGRRLAVDVDPDVGDLVDNWFSATSTPSAETEEVMRTSA